MARRNNHPGGCRGRSETRTPPVAAQDTGACPRQNHLGTAPVAPRHPTAGPAIHPANATATWVSPPSFDLARDFPAGIGPRGDESAGSHRSTF